MLQGTLENSCTIDIDLRSNDQHILSNSFYHPLSGVGVGFID